VSWLTLLPMALVLAVGVAFGAAPLPLHPHWAARTLATIAAAATVTAVGTLVFITVNYAAGIFPRAAERVPEWALFGDDRPVPDAIGVPAVVLTCLVAFLIVRLAVGWSRQIRQAQRSCRQVLDCDAPLALAVPGRRRGGVLVSRGLLRILDRAQLAAVFQHEASHLRHHHHRYLALGELAATILPPLRRLNSRLRFALERWADEDAAEAVGDRALVARTIARVALARSAADAAPPGMPAFTESGVVERVQALLEAAPGRNTITGPLSLTGAGLTTGCLASLAWQLDRFFGLTLPYL